MFDIKEKELDIMNDRLEEILKRQDSFLDALDEGDLIKICRLFVEAQCENVMNLSDVPSTDEGRLEALMIVSSATARVKEQVDSILANFSNH